MSPLGRTQVAGNAPLQALPTLNNQACFFDSHSDGISVRLTIEAVLEMDVVSKGLEDMPPEIKAEIYGLAITATQGITTHCVQIIDKDKFISKGIRYFGKKQDIIDCDGLLGVHAEDFDGVRSEITALMTWRALCLTSRDVRAVADPLLFSVNALDINSMDYAGNVLEANTKFDFPAAKVPLLRQISVLAPTRNYCWDSVNEYNAVGFDLRIETDSQDGPIQHIENAYAVIEEDGIKAVASALKKIKPVWDFAGLMEQASAIRSLVSSVTRNTTLIEVKLENTE